MQPHRLKKEILNSAAHSCFLVQAIKPHVFQSKQKKHIQVLNHVAHLCRLQVHKLHVCKQPDKSQAKMAHHYVDTNECEAFYRN